MKLRTMPLRTTCLIAGLLAAVAAAPAAQAFTFVDPNGTPSSGGSAGHSATTVPKFDIEEHTRQFRSGNAGAATPGTAIREFETPLGKGTVHFGVQQNSAFGSPFSSGFRAQEDRRHMDRMLSAPGLQHRYDR